MNADLEDWNRLAEPWDEKMGEKGNRWHRELIVGQTLALLDLEGSDCVLEIACGNGTFAKTMAERGCRVVATDFSPEMIRRARARWGQGPGLRFEVADARSSEEILCLGKEERFTKAAANMAVMDISDIEPLFMALRSLLPSGGSFVFSSVHPCFQNPGMRKIVEYDDYGEVPVCRSGVKVFGYSEPASLRTKILADSELCATHYHRPIGDIFRTLRRCGFAVDAIEEPVFEAEEGQGFVWRRIPPVIIYRARPAG